MLIELAKKGPDAGTPPKPSISKSLVNAERIQQVGQDADGRAVLILVGGGMSGIGPTLYTWEAYEAVAARYASSSSSPSARMSQADWDAASAAHGG